MLPLENLDDHKGVLLDFEYNNIDSVKATKAWCCVTYDLKTNEVKCFFPSREGSDVDHSEFKEELVDYLKDFDYFVGHNAMQAERIILKRLFDLDIPTEKWIDTLVLSRLFRPEQPYEEKNAWVKSMGLDTRVGGHSLNAWGKRLGDLKIEFDEFDRYSAEMLRYCEQDVLLNVQVFRHLLKEYEILEIPMPCVEIEHKAHWLLTEQRIAGFTLDRVKARKMFEETSSLLEQSVAELHKIFPEEKVFVRQIKPRMVKVPKRDQDGKLVKDANGEKVFELMMHGQDKRTLLNNIHEDAGNGLYNLYVMQTFNPGSPQQVAKRLVSLGWNPKKWTATGQPSVAKDVLEDAINFLAVKVPEVEVLRKYNILAHRNNLAKDWLQLSEEDGRVHGSISHIGTWTHRSSHYEPNMGNIAKAAFDKEGNPVRGILGNFGYESRDCWIAKEGWTLVGCDAAGIQLRALADYMGDEDYIKEVCTGDVHVANMKAAGITKGYGGMSPRDVAKRYIYAWLLGAGDEKIGQIVGVDEEEHEELFALAKKEKRFNRLRQHDYVKGRAVMGKYDNLLWFVHDKLEEEKRTIDRKTAATILKGYFTKKKFLDNLPALRRFKEKDVQEAANQGYMVGLDGRKIWVPNAHFAMGAYLQGFEATIMKWAMVLYQEKLANDNIPFTQVNYVHDEFCVETPPEHAETVGKAMSWAIEEAGRILGCTCPLKGEWHQGKSWAEIH